MKTKKLIKTGIEKIDGTIGGLLPGEVVCIAGRPSAGKSVYVQKLAANICIKNGLDGIYFSLDRSKEKLIEDISDKTSCSIKEIEESKLSIVDNLELSINSLCDIAELNPVSIVFIDSYILIKPENRTGLSYENHKEIMIKLKYLARKLNAPVVITVSCVNNDADTVPALNEVRGAAVVDIAELILLVTKEIDSDVIIAKCNHY